MRKEQWHLITLYGNTKKSFKCYIIAFFPLVPEEYLCCKASRWLYCRVLRFFFMLHYDQIKHVFPFLYP